MVATCGLRYLGMLAARQRQTRDALMFYTVQQRRRFYIPILSPTKAHRCYRARVKGEYESIRLYSDLIRADIAAESQRFSPT